MLNVLSLMPLISLLSAWLYKIQAVDEYVEFYNDYRPHQRLGYLTPNKVEDEYYSQNKTMAKSE